MVVPFVKEGEDVRILIEEDANKRIILTIIKEAFDKRQFTTVDFLAKLKAASTQSGLSQEQQNDLKTMIIQNSGADVYVDAEMVITSSGGANAVKIILTAYDISTGNSLSNKVGESGRFYTEDFGKLGSKAIESCAEDFLNVMQSKFDDIVQNGQSINILIGFDEASEYNMDSEVGNDMLTLADEIEMWLGEHAYKGNFHMQGVSSKQMMIDDLRIPLRDKNGNNYKIGNFWREFTQLARRLGLRASRTISNNSLIITIK